MGILLVEDDDRFASALIAGLEMHGHQVSWCRWGADALLLHRDADLVLLDLGLPDRDMDGLQVLRRLRQVSAVPVIVLTGYPDERLVVRALRCRADDYVVKGQSTFRLAELVARIEVVTLRAAAREEPPPKVVWVEDVCVDLDARTVERAGEPVDLTNLQFKILAVFARHAGQAVSRDQIEDEVWGDALTDSHKLYVHVREIRKKLGPPDLIVTIRGYGYRFG